eukprot:TRINITY_DN90_c0_g1_i1.p1 TRINITY_DN90_c0_g1~~TRINITY_DN90_c0_g1_i1.p1  ORF type:complete len:272 (+),score=118.91 TRINITY_DN90_c0_g1_i1:58-816(+)
MSSSSEEEKKSKKTKRSNDEIEVPAKRQKKEKKAESSDEEEVKPSKKDKKSDKKEKKEKSKKEKKEESESEEEEKPKKKDKKSDKKEKKEKAKKEKENGAESDGEEGNGESKDNEEENPLAPIATPLADESLQRRLFKLVKRSAEDKQIRRGVKEVVKFIRKDINPENAKNKLAIFGGDLSPIDVVSHIPISCENANIPYVYVRSRQKLGKYAGTKRPTSVVMINLKKDSDHAKILKECRDAVKQITPLYGN